MKTPITAFDPPPHWRHFQPLIDELADGSMGIDAVAFLERIGPVFLSYANFAEPLHIRKKHSGRKAAKPTDYYILPRGLAPGGRVGHRIIAVEGNGAIGILDTRRQLDDEELFGKRCLPGAAPKAFAQRMDATLDRPLDRLRRKLGNEAVWIYDLAFLASCDPSSFFQNDAGRDRLADSMLAAAADLIGTGYADTKKRDFLKNKLLACLETHDARLLDLARGLLALARDGLNRRALSVLAQNPTALTLHAYRWLTHDKHPALTAARMAVAEACPIMMLVPTREWPPLTPASPSAAFDASLWLQNALRTDNEQALAFYKSLREESIDAATASRLLALAPYLARAQNGAARPKSTLEWYRLARRVDAAQASARVLERPPMAVFNEMAAQAQADPHDALLARFQTRTPDGFACIEELIVLQNRLAASVLAPKVITEGRRHNLHIPVKHAFYMVAGPRLVERADIARVPRKLRAAIDAFNAQGSLLTLLFEDVPVATLLERASAFGMNRGSWNEKLRDLIYTDRLYEHAADVEWPPLPHIDLDAEGYTVAPLRSQAALLKACDETGSMLWREGKRAVTGPVHFLCVRRDPLRISALAAVCEPARADEPWRVERIEPAGDLRNVDFTTIVEAYLTHPHFLKSVNVGRFEHIRVDLRQRLAARASEGELMGVRNGHPRETSAMIQALRPYIVCREAWSINAQGCFSSPPIDRAVTTLLRTVAPHYGLSALPEF